MDLTKLAKTLKENQNISSASFSKDDHLDIKFKGKNNLLDLQAEVEDGENMTFLIFNMFFKSKLGFKKIFNGIIENWLAKLGYNYHFNLTIVSSCKSVWFWSNNSTIDELVTMIDSFYNDVVPTLHTYDKTKIVETIKDENTACFTYDEVTSALQDSAMFIDVYRNTEDTVEGVTFLYKDCGSYEMSGKVSIEDESKEATIIFFFDYQADRNQRKILKQKTMAWGQSIPNVSHNEYLDDSKYLSHFVVIDNATVDDVVKAAKSFKEYLIPTLENL